MGPPAERGTQGSLFCSRANAPCFPLFRSLFRRVGEAYREAFENPAFSCCIDRQNRPVLASLPVFLPVTRERQPSETGFAGLRPPPGSPHAPRRFPPFQNRWTL